MVLNKQELLNAYNARANDRVLPLEIIKVIVDESKTFLLGDGLDRKIEFESNDTGKQRQTNLKIKESQLYRVLNQAITEALIFESYIDYSILPFRAISFNNVSEVQYDPDNPYKIVYLKEQREIWNPNSKSYDKIDVEHYLSIDEKELENIDLLSPPEYSYTYKEGSKEPVIDTSRNSLPIARIVMGLDGLEPVSLVERLIHCQFELNDVRARINEANKHHKPQLYSIGTSMPQVIGRTNRSKPEAIDTPSGATTFQTSFETAQASIIHLPVSSNARDASITPKLGYAQPVDSTILERQRNIILNDIYTISGVLVMELQNARSASSSSSLSILYEPLLRKTNKRAENLIPALDSLLEELGISDYKIHFPNMMPRNIEAEKLELDKVKNKVISRKTFLIQSGLSEEQAEKEMENLKAERILAVQFSGVITDSIDAPNEQEGNLISNLDSGQEISSPNTTENSVNIDTDDKDTTSLNNEEEN